MDSASRIFTKSVTWQVMGLFTMTLIGFIFTGSVTLGGGIAIVSSTLGFIFYFLHEMVWSNIKWGRKIAGADTQQKTQS
ncbi:MULTISPECIES: DUF2061 domain-containing protein [Pseudovibrio]|jgi:uncharacterized membrane protein|uniref:Uncharacterized membrane protein n=1 Tax=Pseudovibrio ascidiaceicola TaxID=285279 RepID=A0A1I3ZVC2_9HYPH|nr:MULTISPECIES: DUF2061 domain-containing protein [Pseudovibrio]KZL12700.1 hypothetical protein PsAD26_02278 [Pseudovibrio sp. Ad26]KZL24035.1 hypothetical protein PsAD37_02882 [Pseudovibrio sp. Ad37]SFK48045.1 Uncharacterized membrane protein [Pseudovibrio ascidiaceicola]